jgi:hypothetical protein
MSEVEATRIKAHREVAEHVGGVIKSSDIILLIVRTFKRVERRNIQNIFYIISETLNLEMPEVRFVRGLKHPYSSYLEHEIDTLCSLGFMREEITHDADGINRFYELTVYGEMIYLDFIKKEKRYLELERFIELLPLSSTLLNKFAKALFIRRRNIGEYWGMSEEEVEDAVETLSKLIRLGGYEK